MSNAIFVIDDEADVREALSWMLEGCGYQPRCFASAQAFLAELDPTQTGVAIIDIKMPVMDGLELQAELNRVGSPLSQVFLTGNATVPKAVQALQNGALDFLEKPVDGDKLLAIIRQGLARSSQLAQSSRQKADLEQRLASLTPRERDLMERVVAGKANKVIAAELFIAQRTVEIHRHNLFDKMGVSNAAELALLLGRHQAQG
ncbi:two component transcriptional regulator, LuxR family [Ferrimonas balearica DSM 9799]|uniref:Two component transcriptional regulator, LuxR family n=1 Tax=Ferrimonas balearica (strain DSM 9799 / CCM 4581 / KCTC 23876 / PAT) TaxID=550540 RepID=E1SSU4_FERBD|nr:response regulator [Ferrimonas balearica]ADN77098.1 two component transcriptional regulator, LuxR family [Ferrimonas balearica DSM 9799]MBW3139907.1 response regulator [Ferrimonas balearica]MBW3164931.1 response regulator [Ferrimonas balearica]MBY6093931.1 response regulator [Ferrimonas balearica]MBY6106985.1 response regulator [Ferrimonas balearica]